MAEEKEQPIDLNRLSQRELLILCATDIRDLKKDVEAMQKKQYELETELINTKAHGKVWGSVLGFISGFLSGLIGSLFK
jgi:hypothetical protein